MRNAAINSETDNKWYYTCYLKSVTYDIKDDYTYTPIIYRQMMNGRYVISRINGNHTEIFVCERIQLCKECLKNRYELITSIITLSRCPKGWYTNWKL